MEVFKGAPQVIMAMVTNLTDNDITSLNQQINLLASKGYRTLAVAQQRENQPHEFLDLHSALFSHLFEALSTFDSFFNVSNSLVCEIA